MDEETIFMIRRDGFAQLLSCPSGRGMGSDITMHDPPGMMLDDDKDVDQPECCGDDDTEISGQDGRGMIVKKR